MFADLSLTQWLAGALGALLVGLAKGGLPGVGNLAIPLYAFAFGGKPSVGLLLPVLLCGDVAAVIIYRREALWQPIWRLLPATVAGLLAGWLLFDLVPADAFARLVGALLLVMTGAHFLRQRLQGGQTDAQIEALGRNWFFRGSVGLGVGASTMLANAAGPLGAFYLMALRLPKLAFVGTMAWFFFIVNAIKIPLQVELGILTFDTLLLSLSCGVFAIVGAIIGPFILRRISQEIFGKWVWLMVIAAALKLLW
ncbi:MAG: sulfite exporter TauE/SafE family protein [Opitutales bacterium]